MSDSNTGGFSMNWLGLLGVILVVGKLLGKIDISWFWATMPFWVGFAIFVGVVLMAVSGLGIAELLDWRQRRRWRRR